MIDSVINSINILWIILSFISGAFIMHLFNKKFFNNKNKSNENKINLDVKKELNPNEFLNIKKSMDSIIEEKFKFYMFSKFLPYYTIGKKPDKKDVDDIKEQFYIDVTITFSKEYKKLIKLYFTTDGIQLYINEKFLYHLNKLDSKFYIPRESKETIDAMPMI